MTLSSLPNWSLAAKKAEVTFYRTSDAIRGSGKNRGARHCGRAVTYRSAWPCDSSFNAHLLLTPRHTAWESTGCRSCRRSNGCNSLAGTRNQRGWPQYCPETLQTIQLLAPAQMRRGRRRKSSKRFRRSHEPLLRLSSLRQVQYITIKREHIDLAQEDK